MAKVTLVCGKVCSGKTSYAKALIAGEPAVLLSVDEITISLFGSNAGEGHDIAVERTQQYLFQKSLEILQSGIDVVLDWGFWTREDRQEATEFYKRHDVNFKWHYIDISDVALRENLQKRNHEIEAGQADFYYFDDDLAERFWSMFEVPAKDEINVLIEYHPETEATI